MLLSVYNTFNISRCDMTEDEALVYLRGSWDRSTSRVYDMLTPETFREAIDALVEQHALVRDGDMVRVPMRGPAGFGRALKLNEARTGLVACGV